MNSRIVAGLRDSVAVGLGYIPLGMGMGMLLTGSGLDWWWATVFAVVMYGGSMQYLVVPMIVAREPIAAIALATLLIQFRHVFYGISFPLDLVKPKLAKLYSIHAITDEVYALISAIPRRELSGQRIIAAQVACHSWWITGCTLGAFVGLALPLDPRVLNFVMTALFIVLMIESMGEKIRMEFVLACVVAAVALLAPADLYLPIALSAFTAMLVVSARFAPAVPPASGTDEPRIANGSGAGEGARA
ncbi:AzlC family ABC transporter permease [Trueperella bialowiezensis]|uniref:Inner membrane protein YgaZ n=1 Tax=Trueperella bialowiezensis TaxID=312285 RepID=A0A448PGP5_9ACTO|nr:AzlC family ABC transporter permease [Trueperella bialowiezensis]VEI14078.1 Inner membrane protein YgaZ [Trueperella bialowiezensis]